MSTSDNCKDGASKSNDDVCEMNNRLQNMSTNDTDVDIISVCANCGKGEEENHKLKACTACKLVKYCNRECQIAHRSKHKKECRRRAKEIHDEELFKEPPVEDCPICFIRIPYLCTGSKHMMCCGKVICSGCMCAPVYDNQGNIVKEKKCPLCRTPNATTNEEAKERIKKRLEAGDSFAIHNQGNFYRDGTNGLEQDYTKALEHWHRAGELGHAQAYNNIGLAYDNGMGVEVDRKKATYYYELAAMQGDAEARFNLGAYCNIGSAYCHGEGVEDYKKKGVFYNDLRAMAYKCYNQAGFDRAMKHFIIAARCGNSKALGTIQQLYSNGHATKDDYTKALQSYQTYLGEIKSLQRDKAAAVDEENRYY